MPQDLADARVSLTGHAKAAPADREEAIKDMYKSKKPTSFWADFGDLRPFYMEEVGAVHFNGGFGRAGRKVSCPHRMRHHFDEHINPDDTVDNIHAN